jgi:hypothetical protein
MSINSTSAYHQRQRVNAYRTNSDSYSFFNILTSDALLNTVESLLPDHRERLYSPTETLSMFLAQAMSADRSCQNSVNQSALTRLSGGLQPGSTRTGGYCRARQRLPLEMVSDLTRNIGKQLEQHSPDEWRWQGRRVHLVDGTTVTMPDTAENQAAFPQQRGQQPGLGFPICRIVGITSLSNGGLLNAAIGRFNGKGGDEQTLLRQLSDSFIEGDIVLGDAFFATYFYIYQMQSQGVDIVMEQHGARKRSTDFRFGTSLGIRDHLIVLSKPKIRPKWMTHEQYDESPESITVRECCVGGKVLITTLCNPRIHHKNDLKALYKSRWNIELDLRHIKETMGMNILSCKTPNMVLKEIWVYLLAYNLIRLMIAQSALLTDTLPREISFKHCLQLWVIGVHRINTLDEQQLCDLFLLMAQQRVANRPGRIEPRAVKRRPKAYPLLMIKRDDARNVLTKYGHPRKIK